MAPLEKEIQTRIGANDIQISRLRAQIPSLLMIRCGRIIVDPVKQQDADKLEVAEDTLRKANARMIAANEKIAEITKKDLDQPFTLASLDLKVKAYQTERGSLEQQNIDTERALIRLKTMGFRFGFNTLDPKTGHVTESPDPEKELKIKKQAADARIKELEKGIDKVSKVIAKIEPILQDALRG